jgi:hypothetical protein
MMPIWQQTGMNSSLVHSDFAAEFGRGARPAVVTPEAIESLESELRASLPEAYRMFLREQGAIATPTIPGMIVEARESVWPVLRFLHPAEAISATRKAWRSGLLSSLMAFAEGPEATLFCFARHQKPSRSRDEGPVWGYDPAVAEPVRLTDSFDEWLGEYLDAVYAEEGEAEAQPGADNKRYWYT